MVNLRFVNVIKTKIFKQMKLLKGFLAIALVSLIAVSCKEAKDKAVEATDKVEEVAGEAKEAAGEAVEEVKEATEEAVDSLKAKADDAVEAVKEEVKN